VSCHSHVLVSPALTRWVRRTAVVTALAAVLAGLVVVPAGRPAAAFESVSGVRVNAVEARLLRLINRARTSRGIPALRIVPGFTDVARRWSGRMATKRAMAHNPSLVSHVVAGGGADWRAVAENVGYGYDADTLFASYMRSAPHRANILGRAYRYVGIGWAERPGGLGFNTQVFVNTYSWSYGRSRVPAYGGIDDAGTVTKSGPFATFESFDPRATVVRASGTNVSARIEPAGDNDGSARVTVRQVSLAATGGGGLTLRTSTRFNRVRRMSLTIIADTPTGRPARVQLLARVLFGGTTKQVGAVTLRDGVRTTVSFALPADARVWRNEVLVYVPKSSLTDISPGSLTRRYVRLAIYRIGMTV
jgi:uncharacterized protein YkwD